MPRTEEQRAKDRAYYEKNKERIKAYREKNKEKLKEQRKKWDKKYRESEKGKEYMKEYRKTGNSKKSNTISRWKRNGLIGDYDVIYDKYINSTHCELCKKPYKNTKDRHMDHEHISGQFRHICCNSCNSNMLDKTIHSDNKSGIKNVCYNKKYDNWQYNKTFNKQTFNYNNQNKNLVLWAKFYDHIILSNHPELCCNID